jgi:hypothetical protein
MIRKSGYRISEKIRLKQKAKATWRCNLKIMSLWMILNLFRAVTSAVLAAETSRPL